MINNNRDDFNQCVALVFELLYQEFPQEINITVDELIESFDEEVTDNYAATIRFLQREGLIRYQTLNYDTFTGVVLTAKGLKILDAHSDNVEKEETIAQQISIALQQKNNQVIKTTIQQIIKLAV